MIEKWGVHPIFSRYAISTVGRVMRVAKSRGTRPGRILKLSLAKKSGYLRVNLGGQVKTVHSLVLETFVGPMPKNKEACHEDDDKRNNRISNLYWGTRSANYSDRVKNGGGNHGERHGMAKLRNEQIPQIRYLARTQPHRSVAVVFGVTESAIEHIISGRRWRKIK